MFLFKPLQYQQALLQNHYDPYAESLTDYCAYLTRFDANAKIQKVLDAKLNPKNNGKHGKSKRKRNPTIAITCL